MEILLFSLGSLGLPLVIIYLDWKYGIKDILLAIIEPIKKLVHYLRFRKIKIYKQNFHLSGYNTSTGNPFILDFVKELFNELNTRPDKRGFKTYNDVIKFYITYETNEEKNGLEFLERCKQIFIKDKKIYDLIKNLDDILRDTQYAEITPFNNFVKDLNVVLDTLLYELNERMDEIYRKG